MLDPQKMDIDEHIDLVDTLGDMLGQIDESKKDKFIDTMPTITQTHLITEEDWPATTKKAKELEHIIRKCNPLAAALPTLAKGSTVPSLYSHIAHSNDKDCKVLLPVSLVHNILHGIGEYCESVPLARTGSYVLSASI